MLKNLKKLLVVCCAFLFAFAATPVNLKAAEGSSNSERVVSMEMLENGVYVVTTIGEDEAPVTRATSSKSGHKTRNFYNADNVLLLSLTVNGSFTYNGSSSSCTSASPSVSIPSSVYKCSYKSASKSGATAKAVATFKKYMLGIVVGSMDIDVTLTCSKTGVLS